MQADYIVDGCSYRIMETSEIQHLLQTDTQKFVWTKNAILLLIEEYSIRKDKFRDPRIKKKELWSEIKQRFQEKNYSVTEDVLDKKFRNLKKTYIKLADNNKKSTTGGGRVSWEFYDAFVNIFSHDIDNTSQNIQPISNRRRIIKKRLNPFREQLKAEQEKIAVLSSLKAAIDESNAIQLERNKILSDIAKAITGPGHFVNT